MTLKPYIYFLQLAFLVLGGIMGCTSNSRHNVLAFFFDGVPDPNELTMAIEGDSLLMADSLTISENQFPASIPYIFHQPYIQKECDICHNNANMGQLTEVQPDLCYYCHENFSDKYQYLHGPVEGGFCTKCHNPHLAKLESLLLLEGQAICLRCHESERIYKNESHEGIEEYSCTECHNPHGGDNKYYF